MCTAMTILSGFSAGSEDRAADRNLALRRAVLHSSAADYSHTGHLVTDGIIGGVNSWQLVSEDQYGDSPSGEGVANLFDGTTDTKWLTFHNTAYVQLTFPGDEAYAPASYLLASANDEANRDPVNWKLQGSQDGKTFEDIDLRTGESFSARYEKKHYVIAENARKSYRIFRLTITKNKGDYRTQLSEWDLLDENGKSLLRPYGQSFESVWISKGSGEEWVAVDLGGVSRICGVNLFWAGGNYASAYTLQVSDDGKAWRDIRTVGHGSGGEERLTFDETEGSWVRLLCLAGPGKNYQLSELQVLGTNSVEYQLPPQSWPEQAPEVGERVSLTGGNWKLQRASEVRGDGISLSGSFDDGDWLPAAVPGTVLTSYLRAGAIVDPNVSDNQLQISDSFFTADFWYRNSFTIPAEQQGSRTWLNFDAVNWKAEVFFNGAYLGNILGAFTRARFDITPYARYGEENYLAVYIRKNDHPGLVTEQTLQSAGPNGGVLGADNPTVHASIGWDWVPTVRGRNIGIYGDVSLSFTHDVLIQNAWVITDLDTERKDFSKADLRVMGEVCNASDRGVTALVSGRIEGTGLTFTSQPVTLAAGETKEVELARLTMEDPRLWWPNNYGEQYLYTLSLSASVNGEESYTTDFRFGVREFTYSNGSPLQILCNGTRIVCTGGNWGMDDSNLAATREDYFTKVRLHAEANFTMIRNWVGMTWNEAFYDACDQYGILIWDDFWLANPGDGPNPKDEALFMANAADKVKRNRHHAALALYCGRNEGDPPQTLNTALAKLTAEADGTRHYISHSASGTVSGFGPYNVKDPAWYFSNTPRTLHSERGMPNIPEYESLLAMLTEDHAWPIDRVWGLHDYCTDSAQGLSSFAAAMEKYRTSKDLKEFARTAQMVNYENHKAMFEAVHSQESNGLLMWMSQSAWPSMVWQTYDYYYETNAGYFGLKTANQPLNPIWKQNSDLLVVSNATAADRKDLLLVMKIFDRSGKPIFEESYPFEVKADGIAPITRVPRLEETADLQFLELFVYDDTEQEVARNFYWRNVKSYQDYRRLASLPQVTPEIRYEKTGLNRYEITVINTSRNPLLMLRLKAADPATGERALPTYFSDNYLSLMPGEALTVAVETTVEGDPIFTAEGWNTPEIGDFTLEEGLLGDVDGDGRVTSTDARLTLQYSVKKIGEKDLDLQNADVDGDGKATSTDARLILQKATGKIGRFPKEDQPE